VVLQYDGRLFHDHRQKLFQVTFFFNLVSYRFVSSRSRHKFNAHEQYHCATSITEKLFVAQHHFSILQKKITGKKNLWVRLLLPYSQHLIFS
jgi:hypothetical protein